MEVINNENKKIIDIKLLELLSEKGSEMIVYNDENFVYKIFKKDYKLGHKSIEELNYLSSIKTSRILMPESLIFNNDELIGYTMIYIKDEKDIRNDTMANLLNELMIVKQDIDILNKLCVRLIDINKSNIVYNGKLYLIDPGNYYINDVNDLLIYYQNREITEEEKQNLIINWNYNKINKLMHELLFMNNSDIDFYLLRKIIEFFEIERKKDGLIYDAGIYQKYFDKDLTVREAIKKFVSNYIKVDEEENKIDNKAESIIYSDLYIKLYDLIQKKAEILEKVNSKFSSLIEKYELD